MIELVKINLGAMLGVQNGRVVCANREVPVCVQLQIKGGVRYTLVQT